MLYNVRAGLDLVITGRRIYNMNIKLKLNYI